MTLELVRRGARVAAIDRDPAAMTLAESSAYLDAELVRWAKVVKDRNLKAD